MLRTCDLLHLASVLRVMPKADPSRRELNMMDVAIHGLGRELLEDKLEKQRDAAVLKALRSPTDKRPPGGRRRERYEPSAGELAAALSSQMGLGSEPLLGPGKFSPALLAKLVAVQCLCRVIDTVMHAQASAMSSDEASGLPNSYVVEDLSRD